MLILLYLLQWLGGAPQDLEQALAQHKVQASVLSAENSSHYQNPVELTLVNISDAPLRVQIPAGSLFQPDDTTYQGYISNRDLVAELAPGETKALPVPAMCIHKHRSAPHDRVSYTYSGNAGGPLLQVAQMVQDMQLEGSVTGQQAVWTVSDGIPLEDVTSFDEPRRQAIVERLARITGRPVPTPPSPDDYLRNLQGTPRFKIGASYDFRLSSVKAIHIAMFSRDNVVVRELYNNPAETPGQKHIDFYFDAGTYTDDLYYFRLLADGEIKLETEMSRN